MPKQHRPIPDLTEEERQRYFNKVIIVKDGCWKWTGSINEARYGSMRIRQNTYSATRIAYYIHHGVDPGKFQVLHNCDNPECSRPDHLYLGTDKENQRD